MEDSGSENGRPVHKRKPRAKGGNGGVKPALLTANDEIRDLIATLKANKVEHFKSATIEVKFSMLAFLPEAEKTPSSKQNNQEEDELLYYSAPNRS